MANVPAPTLITYGDHTIDPATLPASSIAALLRRGVAHYLGNEVASKVSTEATRHANEAVAALGDDADDEAKAAAKAQGVTDAQRAEWKAEHLAKALEAMLGGTMGEGRASGPRKDPHEAAMESIAKAQVQAVLKSSGLKEPRGDKTVTLGGSDFTMAQLIARRLANEKFRPGIEREAKRRVREIEAASKAQAQVEAGAVPTMEDLGL